MTPISNVFENPGYIPKDEKVEQKSEAQKEKLEALRDHIDYEKKIEILKANLDKIENGLFDGRYEIFDRETRVRLMGDPRSSFVYIDNESPALHIIHDYLLKLGYKSAVGTRNTAFTKIFEDRKASPLFEAQG